MPSLLLLFFLLVFTFPPLTTPLCSNSPHLFLFGDSNSDTGNLAAGLGFPINPPNGRAFFNSSMGRLSDGRLVVDFLCSSLNTGFLAPYMESLGSDFRNGASFGVVGAGTMPVGVPFVLGVQVMQFGHFRRRSFELVAKGSSSAITEEGFRWALYMIDIGQNDLSDAFAKNMTYAQVVNRIPSVITEIQNAIKTLYAQGGRNFWVHNTGPLGCLPQKLWLVQTKAQKKAESLDSDGCVASYNSAAKLFNEALLHLCQQMGSDLKDAAIVYVDVYAIKHAIIANASKYGFSNPLIACCGFGGPPYNYNVRVTCGNPGAEACTDGSQFVSWDGVHYTEAANSVIAEKILSENKVGVTFFGPGKSVRHPDHSMFPKAACSTEYMTKNGESSIRGRQHTNISIRGISGLSLSCRMILNAARFHSIGKVNDADTHCQPPLMLTTFTTSMVKPMSYYVYGESMETRAATRLPMRYHIRNTLETYRHICCKMNLVLHVFSSIDTVSLSRCVAPTLLQKRSNIFIAQLDQR